MQDTPLILGIDSALGPCSVALVQDGKVLAEAEETAHGMQSRMLVPMIEALLKQANLNYKDLGAVACTIGPGGFTGIRVGLATARAIALGTHKPLIGLTTLETIAWGSGHTGDVLSSIDAYRGQRYVQRFRLNGDIHPQSDPLAIDEAMVSALAHGAKKIETPPQARHVALLAAHKWNKGEREFPIEPLYIREPDAKLPMTEGLKTSGELL